MEEVWRPGLHGFRGWWRRSWREQNGTESQNQFDWKRSLKSSRPVFGRTPQPRERHRDTKCHVQSFLERLRDSHSTAAAPHTPSFEAVPAAWFSVHVAKPSLSAHDGINLDSLCYLLACIPWEVAVAVGFDILNEWHGYVTYITSTFYVTEAKCHS